jgi:hypothetical protein
LPGADHSDTLNFYGHVRSGFSVLLYFYAEPACDTIGGTGILPHSQRLTLSSSAASSGSAW